MTLNFRTFVLFDAKKCPLIAYFIPHIFRFKWPTFNSLFDISHIFSATLLLLLILHIIVSLIQSASTSRTDSTLFKFLLNLRHSFRLCCRIGFGILSSVILTNGLSKFDSICLLCLIILSVLS
jgi:hypothetical protein